MELVADRGEDYDWLASGFIRVAAVVSAWASSAASPGCSGPKNPIVNLRVFADRNFALGCRLIGIMGFVLYGSAC